jgi:hypothetical protein
MIRKFILSRIHRAATIYLQKVYHTPDFEPDFLVDIATCCID